MNQIDALLQQQQVKIIKKILGPIIPIGETNEDATRLSNLNDTIMVLNELLEDVIQIGKFIDKPEHSLKTAAKEASIFLKELKESL